MKLAYHKIPRVAKSVCTAEQMVAYNIAWRLQLTYLSGWRKLSATGIELHRCEAIQDLIETGMKWYRAAYDYKPGNFDEDAIVCCLRAGLKKYMDRPFIATDYATVGRAFPALYL